MVMPAVRAIAVVVVVVLGALTAAAAPSGIKSGRWYHFRIQILDDTTCRRWGQSSAPCEVTCGKWRLVDPVAPEKIGQITWKQCKPIHESLPTPIPTATPPPTSGSLCVTNPLSWCWREGALVIGGQCMVRCECVRRVPGVHCVGG